MAVQFIGPLVPTTVRAVASKALRDAMLAAALNKGLDTAIGYFGNKPTSEIANTPATELIQDITFAPTINVTPTQKANFEEASKVIADTTGATVSLQNKLAADLNNEVAPRFDAELGDGQFDEAFRKAMADSSGSASQDGIGEAAFKALKKAKRKDTDSYYVSREYSEFRHCTSPAKSGITPIEDLASKAGKSLARHPTFGEFVDEEEMRKAIGLLRRIVRTTSGAGFTGLAVKAGTTLDAIRTSLVNEPNFQIILDQATSNSDIFNQ